MIKKLVIGLMALALCLTAAVLPNALTAHADDGGVQVWGLYNGQIYRFNSSYLTGSGGAAFSQIPGSLTSVTPSPTTVSDQLISLTNSYLTGANSVPAQQQIIALAIDGSYALVNWTDNANSGGEYVASNVGGTWTVLFGSGGQYSASELAVKGVPSSISTYLIANLQPNIRFPI
jgi:hypothetical protein